MGEQTNDICVVALHVGTAILGVVEVLVATEIASRRGNVLDHRGGVQHIGPGVLIFTGDAERAK